MGQANKHLLAQKDMQERNISLETSKDEAERDGFERCNY